MPSVPPAFRDASSPEDLAAWLRDAEQALESGDAARAAALFGRVVAHGDDVVRRDGYRGLARAHEQLGDCGAALEAHAGWLELASDAGERGEILARQGACEAELELWEASAASFAEVARDTTALPSARIEALARQGYALFMLERFEEADAVLAQADAVYEEVERDKSERLSSYYFVGMARFYRAAVLHRRFRDVQIVLPEKAMEAAFKRKLELLSATQDAYNHTIRAKHMFWVSASGYQLGRLFGEFYDALMYAPVPTWLDERQRRIYYEELRKQLRPVIEKGIWVLEKNLETARRLGYASAFVDETAEKLGQLQAALLAQGSWQGPPPRLVPEVESEGAAPPATPELPAADRKLFVPAPTPL